MSRLCGWASAATVSCELVIDGGLLSNPDGGDGLAYAIHHASSSLLASTAKSYVEALYLRPTGGA